MLPVLAVTDPADATILFDLANAELSKGGHDTERTQRLCVLVIALYDEMKRADTDAPTHCAPCDYGNCDDHGTHTA